MQSLVWDMFTNIKNGQLAKRKFVYQPRKKFCESFLKILWNENFILNYSIDLTNKNRIKIILKYYEGQPAINSIKFISKPGKRIYYSTEQIWKIDSSKYFIILSTNQGLKSLIDCKKLKIGGEPFIVIN